MFAKGTKVQRIDAATLIIEGHSRKTSGVWDVSQGRTGTVVDVVTVGRRPPMYIVRPDDPNSGEFPLTENELEVVA